MTDTPNYVMEAVKAYEEGNSRFLVEMFENGVPLYQYPESKQIIVNLLQGKSNRRQGRPPLTRQQKDYQHRILMRVAELYGAGLGLISNGNETNTPTACGVAASIYGLSADYIYRKIWKPNKDNADVSFQISLGAANKESIEKTI